MAEDSAVQKAKWAQDLESAVKADGWGQVIEAVESYKK